MGQSNTRRLTCKDPRIRQRYNERFRRFVQQHRLDRRAFNLQTQIQGSLTSDQQSEYEGISTLRTQGMSMATQGCHKLRMGEVEWNPELQTLRNRMNAWKFQRRKIRGCRVGSRYLQRVLLSADLTPEAVNLPMAEAILAQQENFKAYKLARKEHIASRESWLLQLACSKSQDDGTSEEQHTKSLISIEKQRRQARNVKGMNQKVKTFGTSRIIAPNKEGQWVECMAK
jgi:hypothetical protein